MNRNEAIDTLEKVSREHHVWAKESLQSRIETLLDMKFETDEKLLETIGALWGNVDVRIDNPTGCQVAHRQLTDVSKTYGKPLRNTSELIAAVYDLIPYRNTHNDLEPTIRKILDIPANHDWYQICDEVRLVHKQAAVLHKVVTLLLECGAMSDLTTVLTTVKQLIERGEELTRIEEFASHYSHLGKERVTQVIARLAKSAQRPMKPVKTYWDGVEPLRPGHITHEGEVVHVYLNDASIINEFGMWTAKVTTLKPHLFAKYTEQEREFLQSQVEAGVIKLC